MSGSTGRTDKCQRWADNRPPAENTPRREQQIRDRETLWKLDEDLKRRGSS